MSIKKILGLLIFISITSMAYSQMTIRSYFLAKCKEYEKYYSVQVAALGYAHWMAIHECLKDDINRKILPKEEEVFNNGSNIESSFDSISHELFLTSLDAEISFIASKNITNATRIRMHYNDYIRENNSVIDNSVKKVPFERAIFDTLYQLSVMEGYGSSDAAAVVYTLTIREFEKKVGKTYRLQPFTRQDYEILRQDLLHDLIEINTHLQKKSVMDIIYDFYPIGNKYEPAYSIIESARKNFRNVNNRGDWKRDWKWTWELLN